ncbi:MAG TPA: hypothetical protein VFK05_04775 [Polyangiaceae bacterium]|nr:hypothetical protein [Polyangiaceae bacterium]
MTGFFTRLGEPLAEAERSLARAYLSGLGLAPELSLERVTDSQSATRIIADPNWDRHWWGAEQRERERLRTELLSSAASSQVLSALSRVVDDSLAAEQGTAAAPAAAFGNADDGLKRAAAGALGEARYLSRLAELSGAAPSHPFLAKLSLFAGGRWPLVVLSGCFYVF